MEILTAILYLFGTVLLLLAAYFQFAKENELGALCFLWLHVFLSNIADLIWISING